VNRISACLAISAGLVLIAGTACSNKPPGQKDYVSRIAVARAEKDDQFRKEDEPVPKNRKADFLPLAYFPIDPDYDIPAALEPSEEDVIISVPTSTGAPRQMRKAGTLAFSLKGQPMKLTAFAPIEDQNLEHLTVMFSDLTSGTETYPAGRYIDLDRNATGIYELDFNRAYNPYCYYNASYECPYPPAENRLKVPIRAGERLKTKLET
jgi:uncharacterized protein (DUF1684 family)